LKYVAFLIAYFLSNVSAKYYENPTMFSRVIAKNIGDVFLRYNVVSVNVKFIWIFGGDHLQPRR